MGNLKHILTAAAGLFSARVLSSLAQYTAPSAGPFSEFANEALRQHDPAITNWGLGGNLRLRYEYEDGFAIPDTHDNLYNFNGTPRGGVGTTPGNGYGINPNYSSFVGTELDAIAGWAVTRFLVLEAGYGHFFTADYIHQSLSALGSKDANWVYLQATLQF